MSKVVPMPKPNKPPQRSHTETKLLTLADLESLKQPPFQRPIRITPRVIQFLNELKAARGIITGVLTIGQLPDDPSRWKVDGSHRIEAAKISGLGEFLAEVRTVQFKSMAEMSEEFVRLNSWLVRFKPDDILRGLEQTEPALGKLREVCSSNGFSFIGYDNIRRSSSSSAIVGMSPVLRAWFGSVNDTPRMEVTATKLVVRLDDENITQLGSFLNCAFHAWNTDPQSYRLWGNLNLLVCMWLFRRIVLKQNDGPTKRHVYITVRQFAQCLMSLSADADYRDWLFGRAIIERDRAGCYKRIKEAFVPRLMHELGMKQVKMPGGEWTTGGF